MTERPVSTRREEYAAQTRAALVEAATDLFVRQGFEQASIDQVAAAARVSKGAVYHHFKDKRHLFEAVYETSERGALEQIALETATVEDARERVRLSVAAFLRLYAADPVRRRLIVQAPAALGHERLRQHEDEVALPVLRAVLEDLEEQGLLAPVEPALAARVLLVTLCDTATGLASAEPDERAAAEALDVLLRMTEGLLVPVPTGDGSTG